MPDCEGCGRHVSSGYARVNATRNGDVLDCPSCNADRRDNAPVPGTQWSMREIAHSH